MVLLCCCAKQVQYLWQKDGRLLGTVDVKWDAQAMQDRLQVCDFLFDTCDLGSINAAASFALVMRCVPTNALIYNIMLLLRSLSVYLLLWLL